MNIDSILKLAVRTLKAAFPSAIYNGSISVVTKKFNPNTLVNEEVVTSSQNVEIITDTLTNEEIQASNLLATDLKVYIIGDKINDISFYSFVNFDGEVYKIKKIIDQRVGVKSALWTIACRK